ncbi:hypothetical protein GCM10025857_68150 [Alicyclobacillus contaminans]|uniref:hypothetical protein n=1 Tax=Alicyclobacillus contaminans TaxID=392016 RepID=UPI00047C5987|nr:hypothetical protein [Alicyclobacillus contaminans]GMA52018.1 hypothetical protein GCM10025857_33750 [Alicyclobacillus contaminans]GMA55434.1 hypothetical protein GCM10025857_67910 [Alicyclobacillus contaminans]GMA55458.1 hypothetical protein GCM10025857_68150 [Alicyclobacillus contaminans]
MTTDKKVFTLRLQEENFLKIRTIAERERRSIAMQIEYILEQFILDYERQNGEIHVEKEDEN